MAFPIFIKHKIGNSIHFIFRFPYTYTFFYFYFIGIYLHSKYDYSTQTCSKNNH